MKNVLGAAKEKQRAFLGGFLEDTSSSHNHPWLCKTTPAWLASQMAHQIARGRVLREKKKKNNYFCCVCLQVGTHPASAAWVPSGSFTQSAPLKAPVFCERNARTSYQRKHITDIFPPNRLRVANFRSLSRGLRDVCGASAHERTIVQLGLADEVAFKVNKAWLAFQNIAYLRPRN